MLVDFASRRSVASVDWDAEANHRIANHLATISGLVRTQATRLARQAKGLSVEEAQSIFGDVVARLETVARLHRRFAEKRDGDRIDIADYLRDVVETVVSCLARSASIRTDFGAEAGCYVASEKALALGLIVGELATNSIKYAHPTGVEGRIRLVCRKQPDGALTIEFADDGVGLPEGFDPATDGALGFQLVRSLAQQCSAALVFNSSELGFSLAIRLSAPEGVSAQG